ncbi:GNAT family N-acetyltransferase [Emticicia sp. BO119]|uniref:GNAT family N-acetyltransferase n=1 Tax=Emticicia sp. BO119 TaxID=2757768 RepID=UPI0015F0E65B|nr:GNAT family N-acetyltransferase [Emticicia sp. BO119]MBA4851807.1 GNAT family N-acetyltransferase [Emticicia sp. BO119]
MHVKATKIPLKNILPYRDLYLQEMNRQIRYNACHERGWSDSYLLYADEAVIGYGSVKGQEIADRDTIFEFYLLPQYQRLATRVFAVLLDTCGAKFIEPQSNAPLLTAMLYEFATNIRAEAILFEADSPTNLSVSDVVFRSKEEYETTFGKKVEDGSGYVLEKGGEVVGSGDFLLHYNKPFADLYMEVAESHRNKGLGSFLIQELKKVCYIAGKVPAARCNIQNKASKATLLKGGLKVAGCMLIGEVKIGENN